LAGLLDTVNDFLWRKSCDLAGLFRTKSMGGESQAFHENGASPLSESSTLLGLSDYYVLPAIISSLQKSITEITNTCLSQKHEVYHIPNDEPAENIPPVIEDFIKDPSPTCSWDALNSLFILDLYLAGECYAYIVKIAGKTQIQRLDPRNIEPEGTSLEPKYYYTTGSGRELLDPEYLIVQQLNPSPKNELRGIGIIEANLELFSHARDMIRSRNWRLINSPSIDGVFTEESDGGEVGNDRNIKTILAKYTSPRKAGIPLFLPGNLKYHETSNSLGNLKINENIAILHREIMSIAGLPRFLQENGLRDAGQKFNNHEKQLQYYLTNTITPVLFRLKIIHEAVISLIAPGYGFRYIVPTEIFSREQIEKMVEDGLITPNEARKLHSLPESEDEAMDKFYLPAGRVALEDLSSSQEPPKPPALPPVKPEGEEAPLPPAEEKKPPKKIERGLVRVKSWRDDVNGGWHSFPGNGVWTADELKAKRNTTAIKRDMERLGKASVEKKAKETAKDFGSYLGGCYVGILQKLQGQNAAWEAEAKKNRGKATDDWESRLFDIAKRNAELMPVMDGAHATVGAAAFGNVGAVLTADIPFGSIGRPEVAQKINLLRKTGPLVNDTTKEKLTAVLKSSMEAGHGVADTAQAIMRRFGDDAYKMTPEFAKIFKPGFPTHGKAWDDLMKEVLKTDKLMNRALVIARNEAAVAYTEFSKQALVESGVVKGAQIIGCSQEGEANSNTGCVMGDTAIGGLELKHIMCSGVVIPCSF